MVQGYKTTTEKGIVPSFSLASPLGAYCRVQHEIESISIE